MAGSLDGVLVADFSRVLAGPTATMMLADLGATVVKVERPGVGDDTRHWGPPWTPHSSAYFECVNRNKRSVCLELKDADDLRRARELACRADVLVENFRAGTMDGIGLGYADLSKANAGLVYCSVTGFGSGQGAALPGYDFLVQAVGGLMSITGSPESGPTKAGVALVDILTGKDAAIGILAALHERAASGRGQYVEVALLTSLLAALSNQAASYLTTGVSPGLMGNSHPSITPYETLRCRDGEIAVACGNDSQFVRMTRVLGVEGLAHDERFETNPQRVVHRDDLVERLEAALADDDVDAWVQQLTDAGVPAGRVGDIGSAIDLAQSLGLQPTVSVGSAHPAQVRSPISFGAAPGQAPTPPPDLGEHTEQIVRWLDAPRAPLPS